MTCQVLIQGPDESNVLTRALLDSGLETSFVTERLAQQHHLPWHCSPMVACLGGITPQVKARGPVIIRVTGKNRDGRTHLVNALELTKITSDINSGSSSAIKTKLDTLGQLAPRRLRLWMV